MQSKKQAAVCQDLHNRVTEHQRRCFGERYSGASLSKCLLLEDDVKKLKSFIDKKKNFLILSGAAGCGKTYIVAALMEWVITKFNHFRVWKEYELMKRVREGIDRGWEPTDTLERLIDDDVIIVDDLGSQGHNDWREKMMFELLDIRYNSTRPTIFTTNLDYEDFRDIYGMRITDRLFAKENTYIDLSGAASLRQAGY